MAEVMLTIVPGAWQNDRCLDADTRAFYRHNACVMEPWDGPALVVFTDGKRQLGATLDRNGLRPGRYYVTRDERLILASEVGVVDLDPAELVEKGRLQPGKILLVDWERGRVVEDRELKAMYASKHPYAEWTRHVPSVRDFLPLASRQGHHCQSGAGGSPPSPTSNGNTLVGSGNSSSAGNAATPVSARVPDAAAADSSNSNNNNHHIFHKASKTNSPDRFPGEKKQEEPSAGGQDAESKDLTASLAAGNAVPSVLIIAVNSQPVLNSSNRGGEGGPAQSASAGDALCAVLEDAKPDAHVVADLLTHWDEEHPSYNYAYGGHDAQGGHTAPYGNTSNGEVGLGRAVDRCYVGVGGTTPPHYADNQTYDRSTPERQAERWKGMEIPVLTLFGYTHEKVEMILRPMAQSSNEPLGSMGNDAPLACLSRLPRAPFDYFYQMFAQATNPAIDPIREANVMSLECPIGPEGNLPQVSAAACASRVFLDEPVLDFRRLQVLQRMPGFRGQCVLDLSYAASANVAQQQWNPQAVEEATALELRLDQLCQEAEAAIRAYGATLLLPTHRHVHQHPEGEAYFSRGGANAGTTTGPPPGVGPQNRRKTAPDQQILPLSSLLAVGALHEYLIRQKLRTEVAIVVEAADAFEIHHMACLLGYGADAVYPYMAYLALQRARQKKLVSPIPLHRKIDNYRRAVHQGLLKVMSKCGISCLQSYKGAQLFQAVGLHARVIQKCFNGTDCALSGVGFDIFHTDALRLHAMAMRPLRLPPLVDESCAELPDWGEYHFRSVDQNNEFHMNSPDVIAKLQEAARQNSAEAFARFQEFQDKLAEQAEVRGQLEFIFRDEEEVEVEPAADIVKRFVTGAVSHGAISEETHKAQMHTVKVRAVLAMGLSPSAGTLVAVAADANWSRRGSGRLF
eukprot:gene72-341_t